MRPQDHSRTQFEQRMRLRRAATCISAARVALDAGHLLEAQERLEEACLLDPEGLEARILLEQIRSREPDEGEEPGLAPPWLESQSSGAARRWSHWLAVLIAVVALAALAWWRAPGPDESRIVPAQRPVEPRGGPRHELPRAVDLEPERRAEPSPEGPVDLLGVGQQALGGETSAAPPPPEQATSGQVASARPREAARPPGSPPSALASPSAPAADPTAPEKGSPDTATGSPDSTRAAAPGGSPAAPPADPGGSPPAIPAGSQPSPPPAEPAPVAELLAGKASSPSPEPPMPAAGDATPAALRDVAADEEAIGEVLGQYVDAYNRLDARAASRVWPTVNERALARAFAGLESQGITFEACDLSVDGAEATAACRGRARHVPKVGERDAITHSRRWTFRLQRTTSGWQIVQAEAR